ncbi:MAG: GNAT family N-acetyltransferase [Myxococcota bacterium]
MLSGARRTTLSVRIDDARSLSPRTLAAWAELEGRALEPNAYLSPYFVVPALKHLDPEREVLALLIEARDGSSAEPHLVGIGVFQPVSGTRQFPLPHLVAYRSRHSFLSGLLLDREHAEAAVRALFLQLREHRWRWHGLEFDSTWGDGPTYDLLRAHGFGNGVGHCTWNARLRSVLQPSIDRPQIEAARAKKVSDLKRKRRRLAELGKVTWTVRSDDTPAASVDAFLDLEHRGWKGDNKSSLLSNGANERFFREMMQGFSRAGRAVLVELRLNDRIVASSTNFVSGSGGFAFKIGWEPELAKVSPGAQAELELLERILDDRALGHVDFWDSGAEAGSYMDEFWPGRRQLVSLAVSFSPISMPLIGLVQKARSWRQQLRSFPTGFPVVNESASQKSAGRVT